jgi:erythromycin esterase-like protein
MSDATIIREAVQPLTGSAQDYDSLLALIGEARFVLLGKASHGTHEFYAERAAITKRLIAEPEIQQGIAYAAAEAIIKFVQGHSGTGRRWVKEGDGSIL